MTIKTLAMNLGPLSLLEGWYQDPTTGQWYYYDAEGNRYVYAAGYLYALALWEPAPKVVNVAHGDTLRISVEFKYSGPAKTMKLRGEIGQRRWGLYGRTDIWDCLRLQDTCSFTIGPVTHPITFRSGVVGIPHIDIPILVKPNTGGYMDGGKHYSIYAKLIDGISFTEGETGSFMQEDALFVVSAEPTFSDFKIDDYKQV